ncbi:Carnitine operon protein CaiE [Candidatus Lokiarchaeum ossiferum]
MSFWRTIGTFKSSRIRLPMIFPSPITGKSPQISKKAFIAENATIIGDVIIEAGANIWYGAVLRGDECTIRVGKNTSIQENVTLHSQPGTECIVRDNIVVGHHAMIHGPCDIGSGSLIGINAVVLQGTTVGKGAIVAASATARKEIPSLTLVMGTPAKPKRELGEDHLENAIQAATDYVERGQKFIEAGRSQKGSEHYFKENL